MITRLNSTGLLYTLHLLRSTTSSHVSPCTMSAVAAPPHILAVVTTSTWHHRLSHPGPDALSSLSRSSFIFCTSTTHDFCHACQLSKHTRLPFSYSSSCAKKEFDLMHFDLLTSPVVSVSDCKYYLVILFELFYLILNLTPSPPCPFFAYVAIQFSSTVKAIQCDNGREFDNSSTWTFLLSKGT
jgi:hypothetical protein